MSSRISVVNSQLGRQQARCGRAHANADGASRHKAGQRIQRHYSHSQSEVGATVCVAAAVAVALAHLRLKAVCPAWSAPVNRPGTPATRLIQQALQAAPVMTVMEISTLAFASDLYL